MTWYDDNEQIAFPLVGDGDFAIAHDLIVDVLVHAPTALGGQAAVTSLSVTGLVVSAVISIDGSPVGFVTVENSDDLVQVPQELQGIEPGVTGTITFGGGIRRRRLRVDGTYPLVDGTLISFPVDLSSPTALLRGAPLFGRVNLVAGDGFIVEPRELDILDESAVVQTVTAAVIALEPDEQLTPINPCEISAESDALDTPPVREINGVPPDPGTGDIDLQALTIKLDPAEGEINLTSPGDGQIVFTDTGEPCE